MTVYDEYTRSLWAVDAAYVDYFRVYKYHDQPLRSCTGDWTERKKAFEDAVITLADAFRARDAAKKVCEGRQIK